jgi:hypothetical protein
MNYNLPDIPAGMRWKIAPSVVSTITNVKLQHKGWLFWHTVASTSVFNNRVAEGGLTSAARRLLSEYNAVVEYGTKEGTL